MTYVLAAVLALVVTVMVVWNGYTAWRFDRQLSIERARVDALLDRVQAGSYSQFKAFENAYPDLSEPQPVRWVRDSTGLIEVPIYDEAE